MIEQTNRPVQHAPTVGAIAVVAYTIANVIHEGGGHGGACLAVGGRPEMLNAIFFACNEASLTDTAMRIVSAGGSVLNILVAGLLGGVLRVFPSPSPHTRFFLWLLMALNLLTAFGYLLFSGVGGVGDWAAVIAGLPSQGLLRIAEIGLGAILYFVVAPRILTPGLEPFLGQKSAERLQSARRLTVMPYFVGGMTYVVAGLLNPHGLKLVLISAAAASFGGASLLAWYFTTYARRTSGSAEPLALERHRGWFVAAVVAGALFVFLLGPGITFSAK